MTSLLCKRKATVSYDLEEGELSSAPQKKIKITTTKMSYVSNSTESEIAVSKEKVAIVYNQESGVVQVRASSALVYKAWNSNQVMKRPKFYSPVRYADTVFSESKKMIKKHSSSMIKGVYSQLMHLRKEGLTMLDLNSGISLFSIMDNFERNLQMEIEIVECPHRNMQKEIGRCCCVAHHIKSQYKLEKCHIIIKLLETSIPSEAVLLGCFISNCLQYFINKKGDREFSLPHSNSIESDYSNLMTLQEGEVIDMECNHHNMEQETVASFAWDSQEMKDAILNLFRAFYNNKDVSPFDNGSSYQCDCEPFSLEETHFGINNERVRVQA